MPQRSNEFQRLVKVIQEHLDPNSKVSESAMLNDSVTGEPREVDVIVTGTVGGHAILVSLECRDHGRPSDVQWVEQMQSKHSCLPTNTLVLVSHSGFSASARSKCDFYGIRHVTFSDVASDDPKRLFPDSQSLWGKELEIIVEAIVAEVDAAHGRPAEIIRLAKGENLYSLDHEYLCTAPELAAATLRSPQFVKKVGLDARPEHERLVFGWKPAIIEGFQLCLQREDPPLLHPLSALHVQAKCVVKVCEFSLRHGLFGKHKVAWASGDFLGRLTSLVVSEDADGKSHFSLHLGDGLPTLPAPPPPPPPQTPGPHQSEA